MPAYGGNIRFAKRSGAVYPFALLTNYEDEFEDGYPLSRAEAESLRDDLDNLLNPRPNVVQVSYVGGGDKVTYSYEDPSGELQVDDLVRVEANSTVKVGIVRALGGSGYSGPLKPVLAKFTAEEL